MAKTDIKIQFEATLQRPAEGGDWTFLSLPIEASEQLPTRSMQSVDGTLNGVVFVATLGPDGEGGHWLRVEPELQKAAGVRVGDVVMLTMSPVAVEPEPVVPEDFQAALDAASDKARDTWAGTTAVARRDWIAWIVGGKKAETRVKRVHVAIDKLSKGNKRACCFDRSGMYSKEFSCPVAET